LKDHPESLAKLPPAIVLNGKFEDGAHRVSAIWLLQQRMDPKNPLWENAKLNVQFVKQGVAEGDDRTVANIKNYERELAKYKKFNANGAHDVKIKNLEKIIANLKSKQGVAEGKRRDGK